MKNISTWAALAVLAAACAAPALAAPEKDGVKDPESGITLHPPKQDANAAPGSKQQKLADEVKAAMQRVETAPKKDAPRADQALPPVARNDKLIARR